MKLVCKEKCQFVRKIWLPGQELEFNDKDVVKCDCESGCKKCGGTGRIVPPHYFVEKKDRAPVKEEEQDEKGPTEKLREELTSAGVPLDKRWGRTRLEEELIKFRKGV